MSQGNTAIGYYRCPVCNGRHGEVLLVQMQGAAIFSDPASFLGWALCLPHETMHQHGYVAVVEVLEEPVDATTPEEQLEQAQRTGNVFMVLRERWPVLFSSPEPWTPLIFAEPQTVADAVAQNARTLH
jgi:hypothetical protein